jgi:hypothetical protein
VRVVPGGRNNQTRAPTWTGAFVMYIPAMVDQPGPIWALGHRNFDTAAEAVQTQTVMSPNLTNFAMLAR